MIIRSYLWLPKTLIIGILLLDAKYDLCIIPNVIIFFIMTRASAQYCSHGCRHFVSSNVFVSVFLVFSRKYLTYGFASNLESRISISSSLSFPISTFIKMVQDFVFSINFNFLPYSPSTLYILLSTYLLSLFF